MWLGTNVKFALTLEEPPVITHRHNCAVRSTTHPTGTGSLSLVVLLTGAKNRRLSLPSSSTTMLFLSALQNYRCAGLSTRKEPLPHKNMRVVKMDEGVRSTSVKVTIG